MSDASHRGTTPGGVLGLIARREIRQRLRSKLLVVGTAIMSVALMLGVLLPALIGGDGEDPGPPTGEPRQVGVVGELDPAASEAIASVSRRTGERIETVAVADEQTARTELADGSLDAVLLDGERLLVGEPSGVFDEVSVVDVLAEDLGRARAVAAAGADAATVQAALDALPLQVDALGDESAIEIAARFLIGALGAAFLYGTFILYGQWTVTGIIEEKANRVVEILLSTVRPRDLMVGKLLGLGVLGVAQVVIIFLPAAIAGYASNSELLPSGSGLLLLAIVGWWLLGFVFYSVLFAAAGAVVSRPEESQGAVMPIMMLLIVAYGFAFTALSAPNGTPALIGSFLPFTAPIIMVVRTAVGDPPLWQTAAAIASTLGSAALLAILSARIYAGGILNTGRKLSFAQAWRAQR